MHNASDELTESELQSLKEVAKELLNRGIPEEHERKLMRLGLIAKVRLELVLTETGHRRLNVERLR